MSFTDFAPIAAETVWRVVMQAAGYQCQCTGGCKPEGAHKTNPGHRCKREHKPWQPLIVTAAAPTGDPHKDMGAEQVAYCGPCYDGHLAATKRTARAAADKHETDTPLFDLAPEGSDL
ncbi:hypothetical protein ABIA35_009568 [Catenulispora sp. MAP12-49]|uniref:hypothetical protein n=1 Tax=Catenulispora sp. MAP12-49 TaxID=3156302 RepID=UPI00351504E1